MFTRSPVLCIELPGSTYTMCYGLRVSLKGSWFRILVLRMVTLMLRGSETSERWGHALKRN